MNQFEQTYILQLFKYVWRTSSFSMFGMRHTSMTHTVRPCNIHTQIIGILLYQTKNVLQITKSDLVFRTYKSWKSNFKKCKQFYILVFSKKKDVFFKFWWMYNTLYIYFIYRICITDYIFRYLFVISQVFYSVDKKRRYLRQMCIQHNYDVHCTLYKMITIPKIARCMLFFFCNP